MEAKPVPCRGWKGHPWPPICILELSRVSVGMVLGSYTSQFTHTNRPFEYADWKLASQEVKWAESLAKAAIVSMIQCYDSSFRIHRCRRTNWPVSTGCISRVAPFLRNSSVSTIPGGTLATNRSKFSAAMSSRILTSMTACSLFAEGITLSRW